MNHMQISVVVVVVIIAVTVATVVVVLGVAVAILTAVVVAECKIILKIPFDIGLARNSKAAAAIVSLSSTF